MRSVPPQHATFLERTVATLSADLRLLGVAAGGSYLTRMDEFSDIDLVIAVDDAPHAEVMRDRMGIARKLGRLLAAFTGEHVGDARLVICLYGDPLLHVDLKFMRADELAQRVEDPEVLWEREGRMTKALAVGKARWPDPDLQWIEDRVWTWVHYTTSKIARGELFEAEAGLGFLRGRVLGPLALLERGARASGVRRIESAAPAFAAAMEGTLGSHDARSYAEALLVAVALYRGLRERLATDDLVLRLDAEETVMAHVAASIARLRR